ncbi:molybdopterin-dependent oxidoreductase [Candidatus Palauibacter sp.]|uniref:molybdopterin-dependent oxidoreductase n=1 Tax=Candidatus Palauibacter sp. TaxID=3101350 RepID=UPI003B022C6C
MAENGAQPTITLTIDGVEVTVPRGTRVIEAAERVGVVVPRYCYHPGIPTRPAQCRMCLVEVEGRPKLEPSCTLQATDDMVVHTASDTARTARQSVIEFLLVNHPLDCPICDAAGQCMLQDYAYVTNQLESRVDEPKRVMGRARIADDILYFADRCIICTRCVRFMRDVAEDDALIVAQRGDKAYIDTFPGRELDNPFQGNIVDVCPVGALVHEDFVFKARAWDMDATASVCPGCPTGCNVTIDTKENQIVRVKPRHNAAVNSWWMCDYGRRHLVMTNRGVRAEVPLIRDGDALRPVDWATALAWLAEKIEAAGSPGGRAIVSPDASNENLFYVGRLLARLGVEGGEFQVEQGETAALPTVPTLKLRADRAANVAGAGIFGAQRVAALSSGAEAGALVVLDDALDGAGEDFGEAADLFLYLGTRLPAAARNADAVLPISTFAEMDGSFTNFEGRVQRFHQALTPPGSARPAWMILSRVLARLGDGAAVSDIRTAFERMAADVPAFEGLTWDGIGLKGAPVAGTAAAAPAEADA